MNKRAQDSSNKQERTPLRLGHRARGFFTSVIPRKLSLEQQQWVRQQLTEREYNLFMKMPMVDQVHSFRVAQAVVAELNNDPSPVSDEDDKWMISAALLHDVGKTAANLGTIGRVIATLSIAVGGKDMGPHWARTRGMTRRIGLYAMYPELGADMLVLADADPRVAAWAREHHQGELQWSIPVHCGQILSRADDSA